MALIIWSNIFLEKNIVVEYNLPIVYPTARVMFFLIHFDISLKKTLQKSTAILFFRNNCNEIQLFKNRFQMVSSNQFWTWNQSKVGWGYYSNRLISSLAPEKCLVSWSPFLAISGAPVFSTLFYIHISVVVEQFETVFPTLRTQIDSLYFWKLPFCQLETCKNGWLWQQNFKSWQHWFELKKNCCVMIMTIIMKSGTFFLSPSLSLDPHQ